MKTIIFSGTPGTGKTAVATLLSKNLKAEFIDVNKVIENHTLCEEYDKKRKCQIVDVQKLSKTLQHIIKYFKKIGKAKFLIIDSHMSHFLPSKVVDICFITKCDISELSKRLKKKGYSKLKISENLEAEIFNVCYEEALQRSHKIIVVDTTGKTPERTALKLRKFILKNK